MSKPVLVAKASGGTLTPVLAVKHAFFLNIPAVVSLGTSRYARDDPWNPNKLLRLESIFLAYVLQVLFCVYSARLQIFRCAVCRIALH